MNFHRIPFSTQVTVYLRGVKGVCSESTPGEYSQPRNFNIRPQDSITVKYNIVPLVIGEFPIEILVVTRRGNDAVSKMLRVEVRRPIKMNAQCVAQKLNALLKFTCSICMG